MPNVKLEADWRYLAKSVVMRALKRGGQWHWILKDYYEETIAESGRLFRTRRLAEIAGKEAMAEYVSQFNARVKTNKSGGGR